jgi:Tol biopolymer transport system component
LIRRVVHLGIACSIVCGCAHAQSGVTRVSVANGGGESHGLVDGPSISGDGRFVAFGSDASDLLPAGQDTNGVMDVFVRDRRLGTIERVSVGALGAQGNGPSSHSGLSADARYVVFYSEASNLVVGDINGTGDVFVHDRMLHQTRLVSVSVLGGPGFGTSFGPAISGDGRWVEFYSGASDLIPIGLDTNGARDAFLCDLTTSVIQRISVTSTGVQGNYHTGVSQAMPGGTSLSFDGRYAVFGSDAENLDPADTNGRPDVYVHDRVTGATVLVSVDDSGVVGTGASDAPAISGDGRFVLFQSGSATLVPGDTNHYYDLFVRDLVLGRTERVSVGAFGEQLSGPGSPQITLVSNPSISSDGRWVAFNTTLVGAAPGDTNLKSDVFAFDRATRTLHLLSRGVTLASGNAGSFRPAISADGAVVAFQSDAGNLVSNDTNALPDVFAVVVPEPVLTFCVGDGTQTGCPCGNNGAPLHGCANSVSAAGARIVGTGTASVSGDALTLLVQGLPLQASVSIFQGVGYQLPSGFGAPFGDGLRCVGAPFVRLGNRVAVNGALSFGATVAGDPRISSQGLIGPTGGTRTYQAFYRNSQSFCTSSTVNLSNGIRIDWRP